MSSLINIGDFFFRAIKDYEAITAANKAKVFVQLFNYAKEPLAGAKHKIKFGDSTQLPIAIGPGFKDAINLHQNKYKKGVEGIISYTFPGDYRMFVFVNVEPRYSTKQNTIGVCIARSPDKWNDDWYDAMTTGDTSCLGVHEDAGTEPQTLQCCHGDYCIQALITSSHHANLTVLMLPNQFGNFALDIHSEKVPFDQGDLDHILDVPNSCDLPKQCGHPGAGYICYVADSASTSQALSVAVMLFALLFCIV